MQTSIASSYSCDKKPTLGHKGCRNFTNLQIVQILFQQHTLKNHMGQTESIVYYPCCQERVSKVKIQHKRVGICLYCGYHKKMLQSRQRILLKGQTHTICYECFQMLKNIKKDEIEQNSLQFYINKILHRCSECTKVIGYPTEVNNNGTEITCNQCQKLIEVEIDNQSDIHSSVAKTNRSHRSFLSLIQLERRSFLDCGTKNIDKSQEKTSISKIESFKFDRTFYESRTNSQLIDIIEEISLKMYLIQSGQFKQPSNKQSYFPQNHSQKSNIHKSVPFCKRSLQPELNTSKHSTGSNVTYLYSQTTPILNISPFSKQKDISESNQDSTQSINQSQESHDFHQLKQSKSQTNSNIGTQKPLADGQTIYHVPTLSQDATNDFDPQQQINFDQKKIKRSCLASDRTSKVYEQQQEQEDISIDKRQKSHLYVTAPVSYPRNSFSNYPSNFFIKNNSHIQ